MLRSMTLGEAVLSLASNSSAFQEHRRATTVIPSDDPNSVTPSKFIHDVPRDGCAEVST